MDKEELDLNNQDKEDKPLLDLLPEKELKLVGLKTLPQSQLIIQEGKVEEEVEDFDHSLFTLFVILCKIKLNILISELFRVINI